MARTIRFLDIMILLLFLSLIVLSFTANKLVGDLLYVSANGEEYRFSLDTDGVYEVEGEIGITVIEIADGKARFLASPCPNKTCIAQGYQNTLVCLPNKVIATVTVDEVEVDAISR